MVMLKAVSDRPGVDYVEVRDNLYFSKYTYRANMLIHGVRWITSKSSHEAREFRVWCKDHPHTVHDYRIRIEGAHVSVFSNDLTLLLTLKTDTVTPTITQAINNQRADEVRYFVREPKYRHRMYFKSYISQMESLQIKELVDEQRDKINCPYPLYRALRISENSYYRPTFYNTYINVNDENDVTFLLMKYDHLFSKVIRMEKMPEITGMINTL